MKTGLLQKSRAGLDMLEAKLAIRWSIPRPSVPMAGLMAFSGSTLAVWPVAAGWSQAGEGTKLVELGYVTYVCNICIYIYKIGVCVYVFCAYTSMYSMYAYV